MVDRSDEKVLCQDIRTIWHTKLFPLIGSDCDTNGSHDLNILPPFAFQCTDTVHEKH